MFIYTQVRSKHCVLVTCTPQNAETVPLRTSGQYGAKQNDEHYHYIVLSIPPLLRPPYVQIFYSAPCFHISSIYVLPLGWETMFYIQQNKKQNYSFVNFFYPDQQTGARYILYPTASRPALGATHPMSTGGSFPGCKAPGAWSWPFISIVPRLGLMELYPQSPIRLHGIVLN
jgi:hypothetical protein